MNCPICKQKDISAAHILGHSKSDAKAKSSANNGKLGGRPRTHNGRGKSKNDTSPHPHAKGMRK